MIYVTSDIHGNKERYQSLMSKINLKSDDTLYILGDVIDRHPDGIKILLEIMDSENIKMLLGNHEYMMRNALLVDYDETIVEDPNCIDLWYNNGGRVTHKAFKEQPLKVQRRILRFLNQLPVNIDLDVNGNRFKLVHATSLTKYSYYKRNSWYGDRYFDKIEYAVWQRWYRGDSKPRNYSMIFGHTPTCHYQKNNPMKIYRNGRIIGIDCGCGFPMKDYRGPRLACLRLDDMAEFYSEIF